MTAHFDHEAILRAHLRAAANSLEPSDDGLERIRARLRQPRSVSARLRAAYTEIVMHTPTRLQDMVYQLADWIRLATERFAPTQTPGRHRSRTQGLLRPLAAMAVVMFIVAAGTYVAIDASTAIFPSSSSNAPSGGPNAGGHSGGAANGSSHASGTRGPAGTGTRRAAAPSCKPTSPTTTTTTPAVPPAPSASPSDNPSPTDSATSADPSAAPSDTTVASPPPSAAPSVEPSANPPTTSSGPALAKPC